jgi:DNA polymerase-3 subunit alpha
LTVSLRYPKLVDKAIKDGMKGMAITDHGVMFGIKEFSDYTNRSQKKRKDEGLEPFKPILGCEMYVAHHRLTDKVKENGDMILVTILLYCQELQWI